jgi:hypothetical protein
MRVVPTEALAFHCALIGLLVSGLICFIDSAGWYGNLIFVVVAIACYWVVLIYLRRPGRLKAWWRGQVLDRSKARFSVGVIVQFLDTLHLLLFFVTLLAIIANFIFSAQSDRSVSWVEALSATLSAASLGGFPSITPSSFSTALLLALASVIGLVATALWIAIFMRAFDAVFRFGPDDSGPDA